MKKKTKSEVAWHKADIVAAVRKRGTSLEGISRALGLTRSAGSRALIFPHSRVNKAIAEVIGKPVHQIWPQWFDADGEYLTGRLSARSRIGSPTGNAVESRPADL